MIFVNATAWPTLLERLQAEKKLNSYTHERVRAEHFVKQLDVIVDFVSSVISNIQSLHKKAGDDGGDASDWEMEQLWDSGDDEKEKTKNRNLEFLNPLQLYDSEGKLKDNNKSLDLTNKVGYLFDGVMAVDVFKGFTFEKGSEEEVLKESVYTGWLDKAEVIKAIIPIGLDLVTIEFEYSRDNCKTMKETLLFRKGQLTKKVLFPAAYGDLFTDKSPDSYTLFTALSYGTSRTFYLALMDAPK